MRKQLTSVQPAITGKVLRLVGCLVSLFFLIVLPSVALPLEYRQSQSGQEDQTAISLNVDLVVLHATVQNRKHILVSGLGKDDFQVYEDGVLQQIESFSREDIPVTVGLVVDNSGSMRSKRSEVIVAALTFARSSNPKDQMFLINFNEKVSFGLPNHTLFTNNAAQLEVALSKISANGMTALYDAVAVALEHLNKGNLDKRALIVISDGSDNASKHNFEQILSIAKQSDAIIYTVGLFEEGDPDRNPHALKELAKATGGEAFLPESVKDIVPICERIAHDFRNQYTISYIPANIKHDGAYRAIQVKAGASRGGLVVRTRAGYHALLKP